MGQIGSADQIPVYFDMQSDSAVNTVRDKTAHMHTCYEKQ